MNTDQNSQPSLDHPVVLQSVLRLLPNSPPLEDGSPAFELDVVRALVPGKTYYSVDAVFFSVRGIEWPRPDGSEQVDGSTGPATECPKCHRREGRTDFFQWEGRTVMDLPCHGFLIKDHNA